MMLGGCLYTKDGPIYDVVQDIYGNILRGTIDGTVYTANSNTDIRKIRKDIPCRADEKSLVNEWPVPPEVATREKFDLGEISSSDSDVEEMLESAENDATTEIATLEIADQLSLNHILAHLPTPRCKNVYGIEPMPVTKPLGNADQIDWKNMHQTANQFILQKEEEDLQPAFHLPAHLPLPPSYKSEVIPHFRTFMAEHDRKWKDDGNYANLEKLNRETWKRVRRSNVWWYQMNGETYLHGQRQWYLRLWNPECVNPTEYYIPLPLDVYTPNDYQLAPWATDDMPKFLFSYWILDCEYWNWGEVDVFTQNTRPMLSPEMAPRWKQMAQNSSTWFWTKDWLFVRYYPEKFMYRQNIHRITDGNVETIMSGFVDVPMDKQSKDYYYSYALASFLLDRV